MTVPRSSQVNLGHTGRHVERGPDRGIVTKQRWRRRGGGGGGGGGEVSCTTISVPIYL